MGTPKASASSKSLVDGHEKRSLTWKFQQQRMWAWHPPKNCVWPMVALYCLIGSAFVWYGFQLQSGVQNMYEFKQEYTTDSTEYKTVDIKLDKDVEGLLWVYFELHHFHQNHRRYSRSIETKQFEGTHLDLDLHKSSCVLDRKDTVVLQNQNEKDNRILYPCGLIARSVFTDTFTIAKFVGDSTTGTRVEVDSSPEVLAWQVDRELIKQIDPEATQKGKDKTNQELYDMWMTEIFPPVTCVRNKFHKDKQYEPVVVGTKEVGGMKVADCKNYRDKPECNFVQKGKPLACKGEWTQVEHKEWGIESGHLLVWLRLAGLPDFRKVYGRIDARGEKKLKKGTLLRVYIHGNYNVEKFSGKKFVVLTSSGALGGPSDVYNMACAYIILGVLGIVYGMCRAFHAVMCPHRSGFF